MEGSTRLFQFRALSLMAWIEVLVACVTYTRDSKTDRVTPSDERERKGPQVKGASSSATSFKSVGSRT